MVDLAENEGQTLVIHTDEDKKAVVVPYNDYESLIATLSGTVPFIPLTTGE